MRRASFYTILVAFASALLFACGGGDGGGGGTPPDTTPPTITSTSPANGDTNVAINSAISATFNEVMDSSSITTATFTLSAGGSTISGAVTYSGTTALFTPSSNLEYGTAYTATITTGAKDAAGNAMATPYTWSFTTQVAPAPTVDVTGTWTGTYSTSLVPSTPVTLNLTQQAVSSTSMSITYADKSTKKVIQTAANVTGTFTAPEVEGTVSGTVSGNTLTFTLNQTTASCPGTFNGIATVNGNTMSFTFTGSDCMGTHSNGQGAVTKQIQTVTGPTNLTATAISTTQIDLSWTDNSNNEEHFTIERKTGPDGSYTEIATIGADVTAYSDTGLTANTTYSYRVKAFNSVLGDSAYSNEASATTQGGLVISDGQFKGTDGQTALTVKDNKITSISVWMDVTSRCTPIIGAGFSYGNPADGDPVTNGEFTTQWTHKDTGYPGSSGRTYTVHASGIFSDNDHVSGTWSYSDDKACSMAGQWSATRTQ